MLKGLALTPPIVGRISIGKVVERGGKRLPEKDDEFTITSQIQSKDGWIAHPLDASLREAAGAGSKLRSIPVRLLFDHPDLNLRSAYSLFDKRSGRPMCVGDGETCRRATADGVRPLPCPSPDGCEFAAGACKPFGRLNVRIGDDDELGTFIFRTTGFNSIRTLTTRLQYFHAVTSGRLSTIPLELRLRGKSTTQSHRAPIYYVDLTVRTGSTLTEAVTTALSDWDMREVGGLNQKALDEAAREGMARGAFEESVEDGSAVVEEFYPLDGERVHGLGAAGDPASSLADRLSRRLASTAEASSTRSPMPPGQSAPPAPAQEPPRS